MTGGRTGLGVGRGCKGRVLAGCGADPGARPGGGEGPRGEAPTGRQPRGWLRAPNATDLRPAAAAQPPCPA